MATKNVRRNSKLPSSKRPRRRQSRRSTKTVDRATSADEATSDLSAAPVVAIGSESLERSARVKLAYRPLRISDLIRSLFPFGTRLSIRRTEGTHRRVRYDLKVGRPKVNWNKRKDDWQVAPALPSDMFAISAMLLDLSGACHHIVREPPKSRSGDGWRRNLVVTTAQLDSAKEIGERWRQTKVFKGLDITAPLDVQGHWDRILGYWNKPIFRKLDPDRPPPGWWIDALMLLIASDQAAAGAGFPRTRRLGVFDHLFDALLWAANPERRMADMPDDQLAVPVQAAHTISNVPASIAGVLPKARTAPLGCTLRSLSHHLALLPPEGRARAAWHLPVTDFELRDAVEPLNILLVPYPFVTPAHAFKPGEGSKSGSDWSWFSHDHRAWPGNDDTDPQRFVEQFLEVIATKAVKQLGAVHGLVLPESSIDHDTFRYLCRRIAAASRESPWRSIDFVTCGLRRDQKGNIGNHAAAAVFASKIPTDGSPRMYLMNSQQKHHRWRLDKSQILTYGLGASLSPHEPWWESIELLSRSLNIYVFRKGAAFAPLICEDLARVDPVHDLIRAIGPNLVIALLMDGGQCASRWTGRSAMGLADDPGSSVLTLTSYGLVARANEHLPARETTSSIGLWRDQEGTTREIHIAPGASAVVLSLAGERIREFTLEGRDDRRKAVRWTFADQVSVSLKETNPSWEQEGWTSPSTPLGTSRT